MASGRIRLGAAAGAIAALLACGSPAARTVRRNHSVRVSAVVGPGPRSARLPPSFLGISQEYDAVERWTGVPGFGVDTPLVALLKLLARQGSGAPTFRVGGGSTDNSWWNPMNQKRPVGLQIGVNPLWVAGMRAFEDAAHVPLILGLNLGIRRPSVAAAWAKAATGFFGKDIRAFEIGNEPDFFNRRVLDARYPHDGNMRPRRYSPAAWAHEFARSALATKRAAPTAKIAGPGLCCDDRWFGALPRMITQERRFLRLVTVHDYPLLGCHLKRGQPGYPTPGNLLATRTFSSAAHKLAAAVKAARAHHLAIRLTESNSVACGGSRGTSDVFASSLWAANWAFVLDLIGFAGVDFHASSPTYAPLVPFLDQQGWGAVVQPEYYGMLFFSKATAHRSRMLPATTYISTPGPSQGGPWVWAFRDPVDRVIRVAVFDMTRSTRYRMAVKIGSGGGSASVVRLSAPSLSSRSGITFGGQHFARPTRDAALIGRRAVGRVPRSKGTYRFVVRPTSAVLLTVPLR